MPKTDRPGLNVFEGEDAIKDFLDPGSHPFLPLVELSSELNPFRKDKVRIFLKLMEALPLGNVKSLPAYQMLLEAEQAGRLKNVRNLIESSSGNTVFSLAAIARAFGIRRTKAIVSHEVTPGKLKLLRLFGTEISVNEEPICPDPSDAESGIQKARRGGRAKGWFNPGQYDNEANPRAHERWTGPQIWEQTGGKISILAAGLGTTGTVLGTSRYLKRRSPKVFTVGIARKANNPVPGVRTPNLLREIAFDWKPWVDEVREVGTKAAFETSLALCRTGIMAGPSSGFALAGLFDALKEKKRDGSLKKLRAGRGEIVAVVICPDGPLPYLDEYFEHLDQSHFPKIQGEELLLAKPAVSGERTQQPTKYSEMDVTKAHAAIYPLSPAEVWHKLRGGEKVPLRKNTAVIDIRTQNEFVHFHLPGSRRMDSSIIMKNLGKFSKEWNAKKIFLICPMGVRTQALAGFLRKKGVEAYSIRGGTTEWSARDLPRWRPDVCLPKHR